MSSINWTGNSRQVSEAAAPRWPRLGTRVTHAVPHAPLRPTAGTVIGGGALAAGLRLLSQKSGVETIDGTHLSALEEKLKEPTPVRGRQARSGPTGSTGQSMASISAATK